MSCIGRRYFYPAKSRVLSNVTDAYTPIQEEYGRNTRDVLERLVIIAENRPVGALRFFSSHKLTLVQDPYFPPVKHNLAWYLKRSRSVACLRELRPLPRIIPDDEDHEFVALESDDD
jgi:hypothetical protein